MDNAKAHHSSDPEIILACQSWAEYSKQTRLQTITEHKQALVPNLGNTNLTRLEQVSQIKSER